MSWIADEDHDRLDALGGAASSRAAAARQVDQLRAQLGMQTILEARDDLAALARRETDAIVAAERDMHATADERSAAVRLSPRVVPPGSWLIWLHVRAGVIVGSVHAIDPIADSDFLVRTRK